jgi:hypothetical protein
MVDNKTTYQEPESMTVDPDSFLAARIRLTFAIDEAKREISTLLLPHLTELAEEMTAAIDESVRWLGHRYQVALAVVLVLLTLIIGVT